MGSVAFLSRLKSQEAMASYILFSYSREQVSNQKNGCSYVKMSTKKNALLFESELFSFIKHVLPSSNFIAVVL